MTATGTKSDSAGRITTKKTEKGFWSKEGSRNRMKRLIVMVLLMLALATPVAADLNTVSEKTPEELAVYSRKRHNRCFYKGH